MHSRGMKCSIRICKVYLSYLLYRKVFSLYRNLTKILSKDNETWNVSKFPSIKNSIFCVLDRKCFDIICTRSFLSRTTWLALVGDPCWEAITYSASKCPFWLQHSFRENFDLFFIILFSVSKNYAEIYWLL